MPSRTIKKKSSTKKKPPGRVRRPGTTPLRSVASSAEEELFAKAFRSSPHPIGITELESGRCLEVNDACLEIFGFRRDEVIGQTTLMLGIWPDPRERSRFIDQLSAEGTVRNWELPMRMKNGGLRQFLISSEVIMLGGKHCLMTIGNDITDRKKAEDALRESEQRFHAIYDQTYEFIGLLTPDGTLVDVNQTALAFRGLQRSDVVGKLFWETPWWDISPALQERLKSAIAEAATGKFVPLRAQHRTQEGSIEEIDFSLTPITDRTGRVTEIIPEGRRITPLVMTLDQLRHTQETLERLVQKRTVSLMQLNEQLQAEITERKQAEEALQFAKFSIERAADAVYWVDPRARILGVNEAASRMLGYSKDELCTMTVHDLNPDFQADRWPEFWADTQRRGIMVLETFHRAKNGQLIPIEVSVNYLSYEGKEYHCAFVRNITERKRAEEALLKNRRELESSQAQLQDLTAKLLTAQDSERQRIARDLHDDVSQRLAALTFDVASLQRQPPLLPELIGKALEPVREELTQLSDDLRQLAHQLHPSLLKHAGLRAALEEHIHQAMRRTGLHMTLTVKDVSDSLPLDLATCLFRVFQESLQNVAKHANATEVLVKLSGSTKGIGLSVRDNGTGFDFYDKSSHQKGLGLISMRERLRMLNGFLNIHSRPADGTRVCAWIPSQEKTP
ncbi:MAG: PAS domain S-box protein [Nitrospira sp.]|nr:PAS domain S-box protein [Nitrospira sp.]